MIWIFRINLRKGDKSPAIIGPSADLRELVDGGGVGHDGGRPGLRGEGGDGGERGPRPCKGVREHSGGIGLRPDHLLHGLEGVTEQELAPLRGAEEVAHRRKRAALDVLEQQRWAPRLKDPSVDQRDDEVWVELLRDAHQVPMGFEVENSGAEASVRHRLGSNPSLRVGCPRRCTIQKLIISLTTLLILGCGGVSADVEEALAPGCAPFLEINPKIHLVTRAEAPQEPPTTPHLQISPTDAILNGRHHKGDKIVEALRALGHPERITLSVDANTPAERLLPVLQELSGQEVILPFDTGKPSPAPVYVNERYASAIEQSLSTVKSEDKRNKILANRIADQFDWCPQGAEVFTEAAKLPPAERCLAINRGLAETLPSCRFTPGDLILTELQMMNDHPRRLLTTQSITLDPEGEEVSVLPQQTWAEISTQIQGKSSLHFVMKPEGAPHE